MPSSTKKAQKRHRCSNCDARFGYFREDGKEWVCRACGKVENAAQVPERKKLIDIFKEDLG